MFTTDVAHAASARRGLILAAELGSQPARAAQRHGLVLVQPQVYVAASQPLDPRAALEAVRLSLPWSGWAFMAGTALWLYEAGPAPEEVEVGVPRGREVRLMPPARARRVTPGVLEVVSHRHGQPVVSLETAALQVAATTSVLEAERMVEQLLRARLTTADRLSAVGGRGRAGSAVLRAAVAAVVQDGSELRQRVLLRALREAGVTGFESEVRLTSRSGAIAYLDALHRPSMRALEVDGAASHGSSAQQLADRRRDRWVLQEYGFETIRVAVREVDRNLRNLVQELVPLFGGGRVAGPGRWTPGCAGSRRVSPGLASDLGGILDRRWS